MPRRKAASFLNDDCGQNALQLAARGSAIIAEILRLSEHIPNVFKEPQLFPSYSKIICDFNYFNIQDKFEKAITDSAELLERDEEFRQTHMELLDRFHKLFRGVFGYVTELNRFVEEIRDEMYISQTLESILVDSDGKQLLCEVYYLYGVMLLLLDYLIGGKVREYLLVSYIRYAGAGGQHTVEISSMCRDTGYRRDQKPPEDYPAGYFARVKVDLQVVAMLIGRLRSDDVYQMSYHYPAPEHKSTSLANQAAMLYILLYFRPEILHHERNVLREIVDKHFPDNWIINYYMGFTTDLTVAWKNFKAANAAIQGTIEPENVSYHQNRMKTAMRAVTVEIRGFLREGVLTEQYVLDSIHSVLLPRIREANVCLRWFVLHMTRGPPGRRYVEKHKAIYDIVCKDVDTDEVLTLLLMTAQLEFIIKGMFAQLLKEKRSKWESAKEQGTTKMQKLATYFSGEHILSEGVRVAQLETWFSEIATRIENLNYKDTTTAGRKIQKMMKALENVQEFHQIDANLQVVQFLQDTRFLLRQMIRYTNIEQKVLISIATVGDLSYAWELLSVHGCFVPEIQEKIRRNPHLVIQMRSTFVKLASMLELPCTRIDQGTMHDPTLAVTLESVSSLYSNELVAFVRKVLHVIPISIFSVLKEIVNILLNHLKEASTKIPKSSMKELSQLTIRHRLAALTAEIAKFANGILAMKSTLVGVVQIDPHQLLEDGIRKELVQQISAHLHKTLKFDPKKVLTAMEFDQALQELARQLEGIRESFEYIQDYVNVHGLRIWLEEFSRIVNFNVEMECNSFMQKKLYWWKSRFQSDTIPIPYYERTNETDVYSFLGRIVQHLLAMTDPKRVGYIPCLGAWFELATAAEVVGPRTFTSIRSAVGTRGLTALDKLLCFIIAKELQILIASIRKFTEPHDALFTEVRKDLSPVSGIPLVAQKHYAALDQALSKLFPSATDAMLRIGRIQLLRMHIANAQRSSCKLNSSALFSSLKSANEALLGDIQRHYADPTEHPMPGEIAGELARFLDNAGFCDVQSKVYITSKPMPQLCFVLLSLILSNLQRFAFDERMSCLLPKKRDDSIDAASFCYGVMLTLKQFHSEIRELFFGHLSQYVRISLCEFDHSDPRQKQKEVFPESAFLMSHMIEMLATAAQMPLEQFHRCIPPTLLGEPRLAVPRK